MLLVINYDFMMIACIPSLSGGRGYIFDPSASPVPLTPSIVANLRLQVQTAGIMCKIITSFN